MANKKCVIMLQSEIIEKPSVWPVAEESDDCNDLRNVDEINIKCRKTYRKSEYGCEPVTEDISYHVTGGDDLEKGRIYILTRH